MSGRIIILSVLLAWLALPAAVEAEEKDRRKPVPSEPKQTEALASIRAVYGREMDSAKPGELSRLAEQLIAQAQKESTGESMRYACLKQAYKMGLGSDRPELALKAARAIATRYRVAGIPLEMKALTEIWRGAKDRDTYALAGRGFRRLAVRALRKRDFEHADEALKNFAAAARGSFQRSLIQQASAFQKITGPYSLMLANAQKARQTLSATPDDIKAHQAIGEYLCFACEKWREGLPHLAKGVDADLAGLARADLTDPATPAERMELADGWYRRGMAAKSDILRAGMLQRAAHHYQALLPNSNGLLKSKAETRLAKARETRSEAMPYFRGPVPAGAELFLTFEPDTVRRKDKLLGARDCSGNRLNAILHNATLTDGVLGRAAEFDGKSTHATFQSKTGPLHLTNELSIACWVRTKQAGGWILAQRSPTASRYQGSLPSHGEFMFGLDDEGKPHFWNYYRDYGIKASATKAVTDGKWHHVVFACKDGTYGFYIDGELAGTGKGTARDVRNIPLTMGYDHRHKSNYFCGALDDVLIYDDALSTRKVREIYHSLRP